MLPQRQPPAPGDLRGDLDGWGHRALLGATMRALEDLLGNRDGLWSNEHRSAGQLPDRAMKSPVGEALCQAWSTGLHTSDERATLQAFADLARQRWDGSLTALDIDALPQGRLFAVHKVISMVRNARRPQTVQDTFVRAEGPVDGVELPPNEAFVQCYSPTVRATGDTVVVVPGHAVSGAANAELVKAMCARGHGVVVMALPWQGPLRRPISRGFVLMRDVAAVIAAVQAHTSGRIVVHGSSVGGGVGALGAILLGAAGAISLDDDRVDLALSSPWLGSGWCFADVVPDVTLGSARTRRPDIALLTRGAPLAAVRATQLAVLEDIQLPVDLEVRLESDLERVLTLVADGVRPSGRLCVVHAVDDPFAEVELVRHLSAALGGVLHELSGANHLLALDDATASVAIDCVADLLSTTGSLVHSEPRHGAARDQTLRFLVLAARAGIGRHVLPSDAQDYVYLTVPGLFTERYPGYMVEKFARMAELGLDHARVPIDTDAGVESNAVQIRDSLLNATQDGRQAVLIGHSKGGVDIAAALAMFPALCGRVRAVVTLQAPWLGTPLGDLAQDKAVLSWATRFIVEGAFQGEASALTGIGIRARADFVARYPWPRQVPAVCLATSLRSWSTLLKVPDAMLAATHGPTDGMVPVANALLPGADAVFLRDVDHGGPVLPRPLGNCAHLTPGDMTVALLALALERASRDG